MKLLARIMQFLTDSAARIVVEREKAQVGAIIAEARAQAWGVELGRREGRTYAPPLLRGEMVARRDFRNGIWPK